MIDVKTQLTPETDRLLRAAERAIKGNVRAAAFLVSQTAKASIKTAPKSVATETQSGTKRNAKGQFIKGSGKKNKGRRKRVHSPPGTPPFTRRGKLKRAIQYAADANGAIIGPAFSVVKTGGQPHEFGGQYEGEKFDRRPFMRPALEQNLSRFAGSFEGSIRG